MTMPVQTFEAMTDNEGVVCLNDAARVEAAS